jgi:NAD-dependent deacetylase
MINIPTVKSGHKLAPIRVKRSDRVFVLTGAGISAESGVATFRDAGGLWEQHRVEDVATPEGFGRDPVLVWRFYSQRRSQLSQVKPNPAHEALADLERHLGDNLFLCTQNVDPLHERAGSKRVVHMHGELAVTSCSRTGCTVTRPFGDEKGYLGDLPRCACGALLRPHVVWFGEVPLHLPQIFEALSRCNLFMTVGSSGAVYPAAGFVSHVRNQTAARAIYVGPERPDNAHSFDEIRLGKAGELLPSMFELAD